MDTALRPMSTSQVLDRTFSLYRSNFGLFIGIALITPALSFAARLIQVALFGSPFVGQTHVTPQMSQAIATRSLIASGAAILVYLIGNAIASGATVYAVSMVHLGKPTTIAESYSKIKPVFWRMVGLIISVFFMAIWPLVLSYGLVFVLVLSAPALQRGNVAIRVIAGIIMLVLLGGGLVGGAIWALRVYCRYALSIAACALEKLPLRYSLVRSKFLTKGSLGRVFIIYLLTILMGFVLTYALQAPALIASKTFILNVRSHVSMASLLWIYTAEFLGGMLAGPIATIALALLYYDERVRKEAFDLQLMMQAVTPEQVNQSSAASGMA